MSVRRGGGVLLLISALCCLLVATAGWSPALLLDVDEYSEVFLINLLFGFRGIAAAVCGLGCMLIYIHTRRSAPPRDRGPGSPFTAMPLLVADAFGYEADPAAQATLRRALGPRGGVQGFAAAAVARQVSHAVRKVDSDGNEHGALVPLEWTTTEGTYRDPALDGFVVVAGPSAVWPELVPERTCRSVTLTETDVTMLSYGTLRRLLLLLRQVAYTYQATHIAVVSRLRRQRPRGNANDARLGDYTLYDLPLVESIDLAGLTGVTSVGACFLNYCGRLAIVDLSPLASLTSVDQACMGHCQNLTAADLSQLTALTSIDARFAFGCERLTSVDASGLTALTSVERDFFGCCTSLTSLDLSRLTSLTRVGHGFLRHCELLTSVDLSGLSAVTNIADSFLHECESLTALDLSSMTSLTSVGLGFVSDCEALASVDLSGLTALTRVGPRFLNNTPRLTRLDLSALQAVTTVRSAFLLGCGALPLPPDAIARLPQAMQERLQ